MWLIIQVICFDTFSLQKQSKESCREGERDFGDTKRKRYIERERNRERDRESEREREIRREKEIPPREIHRDT